MLAHYNMAGTNSSLGTTHGTNC